MSPFVLNSSTVCCSSEKSFSSHKIFGFPAFLCIWTLSNNDCIIVRSIFSHRGQLRDSFAIYYRRFKHSLMLQKEKPCIKSRAWKLLNRMKMSTFFLFCLNIISFHLVLPFRSYRIVTCFPEDKLSEIYPDLQIEKVMPWLLIHVFFMLGQLHKLSHHIKTVS